MKSAGKARNNGLYRHIRTSKEIIRNLLNDFMNDKRDQSEKMAGFSDLTIRKLKQNFCFLYQDWTCSVVFS